MEDRRQLRPRPRQAGRLAVDHLPQPGAELRAAMRECILERISAPAHKPEGFVTIRADEGEWVEIARGVRLKKLLRSGNVVADLIRMEPGSSLPGHEHPEPEECFCLEGEVSLGGILVRAGDFHFALQGLPHGPIYSPTGCLVYVRTAHPA